MVEAQAAELQLAVARMALGVAEVLAALVRRRLRLFPEQHIPLLLAQVEPELAVVAVGLAELLRLGLLLAQQAVVAEQATSVAVPLPVAPAGQVRLRFLSLGQQAVTG